MSETADTKIAEILKKYGEPLAGNIWRVQGQAVIYHKTLERIAAQAGITFDPPQVLRAERDEAVILVTGRLGDRSDWSIGEAVINVNYRVSGRQAAYVYAMSEKRAKDRVILKLIGLHGLLYSEEEADDLGKGKPSEDDARPNGAEPPAVRALAPAVAREDAPPLADIERSANPNQARKNEDWEKIQADLLDHCQDNGRMDSGRLILWAKSRRVRLATHPWRAEARERWRSALDEALAHECHSVRELIRWREESHEHTSVLPTDWQLAASAVWEAAKDKTGQHQEAANV